MDDCDPGTSSQHQHRSTGGGGLLLLLPAPRVILGLLAGLEVSWASPLAPRVPLPPHLSSGTPIDAESTTAIQAALGVFPLPGLPKVAQFRARKVSQLNFLRSMSV